MTVILWGFLFMKRWRASERDVEQGTGAQVAGTNSVRTLGRRLGAGLSVRRLKDFFRILLRRSLTRYAFIDSTSLCPWCSGTFE